METFLEWLAQLRLVETYYGVSPDQYNRLFDAELEKVIGRVRDPAHREALLRMRNFDWCRYIAASVRNAGYQDQRQRDEKTHEVVVKLIMEIVHRFRRKIFGAIRFAVQEKCCERHPKRRGVGAEPQAVHPLYRYRTRAWNNRRRRSSRPSIIRL